MNTAVADEEVEFPLKIEKMRAKGGTNRLRQEVTFGQRATGKEVEASL